MRKLHQSFAAAVAMLVAACTTEAPGAGTRYHVYFLGGQSNMEGFGVVGELSDDWLGEVDRVMIYTGKMVADGEAGGGIGLWDGLRPGHGTGFDTDGRRNYFSDRFGPELAFGRAMAQSDPSAHIAIVKYSRGGSSLHPGASGYGSWAPDAPGVNQYDNALTAIRKALAQRDIDADGHSDELIPAAIVWMQGESDAYHSEASARAYRANLKRMMDLLRAALRVDDLPVVIGKITDSGQDDDGKVMDYIEIVQQGQRDFVANDACAAWVTVTDNFSYLDDGWHYDTDGFLQLGAAFAQAVLALHSNCGNLEPFLPEKGLIY